MTATQLTDQMMTETRLALDTAAIQGAALRGELGVEAQDRMIAHFAAEYQALRAAGRMAEARALRQMVLDTVPTK
jgi:hypothetical protein